MESIEKLSDVYGVEVDVLVRELEQGRDSADKIYPPGFIDFLDGFKEIDEDMQQLLLQIENRSANRPQTEEEWMKLYYSVLTILGK
jgi:hypothetical protein